MSFLQSTLRILFLSAVILGQLPISSNPAQAQDAANANFFQSHPVQFPNGVEAHTGVTYSTQIGYRPLRLDIYGNPNFETPRPLILFVHGGAWESGNRQASGEFKDFPSILAGLAARGFVVASVEYRLNGEAPFPAPYHDIQAALRFLRTNASTHRINPEKIGIWGSSSGGQLAALAAVACRTDVLEKVADTADTTSTCVNAAAIWNGVFDFKAMEPAPKLSQAAHPRSRLLSCTPGSCTNAALLTASPITYVDQKSPPFFLAHSRADNVVPFAQSEEFENKLRDNGIEVTTHYVDGLKHGFRSDDPAVTTKAGEELLQLTFSFFEAKLN
jgi:acetyl esterase/lipase